MSHAGRLPRRALVTGATGLLGSHVVARLVQAGCEVRGLVRRPAAGAFLEALGAGVVAGDVNDAASLHAAAAGCETVFHTAAVIGPGGDWEAYRLGNVEGTANVVAAAAAAGCRLVHVSSTAVFGRHRYHDRPTDELVLLPELPVQDAYGRSKQQAERLVLDAHGAGQLWACVVRPPIMYGRRDRQLTPRLGSLLRWGVAPLVAGGAATLPLVHADSVAEGALRAAAHEAAGGRVYHLTNDFDLSAADLLRYASEGLGHRVWPLPISAGAARLGFKVLGLALRAAGRPDLARHAGSTLEMLLRNNPFSSGRARRELGWQPTLAPATGVPEAFRWWRDRGG